MGVGALLFGGVGAGLASQGVAYLIGFGAVLGLMCGVGVEYIRRPLPATPAQHASAASGVSLQEYYTAPAASGVMTGFLMDGMLDAKKPGFDLDEASTAAGSFATNMSASLLSS